MYAKKDFAMAKVLTSASLSLTTTIKLASLSNFKSQARRNRTWSAAQRMIGG